MGIGLAEPGFHTRAYVEWDDYPRQCLIAAQRAGYLAPAPIWDDLTSFDARPLAGAIDTVLAGYPCQPFSNAGQRRGADDPRHLWPHVARVCRELGDRLRWIVLENVSGHVSLGAEAVLRELWDMGFTPAAGLVSAREVGAPHERLRWFCVAYRDTDADARRLDGKGADRTQGRSEVVSEERQRIRSGVGGGRNQLVHIDGGHPGAERQQRFQPEGGSLVDDRADRAGGIHPGRREEGQGAPDAGGSGTADVGNAPRLGRREGWAEPSDERHRTPAHGSAAEFRGARLFPPGPGESAAWAAVLAANPAGAPAVSRADAARAALRLAAVVPADAASTLADRAGGMAGDDLLREMARETSGMVDAQAAFAGFRDVAHGLAQRSRALRLLGNGVCPLAAGYAWRTLSAAHGLGPVDLVSPGAGGGPGAVEFGVT